MALSEYEKQVLEEMEAEFRRDDPEFASRLKGAPSAASAPRGRFSARRVAAGGVLALVGLAVVILGVSLAHAWVSVAVGVAGFLVMLGGVLLALRTSPASGEGRAVKRPRGSRSSGWQGFLRDQERRWDERSRD